MIGIYAETAKRYWAKGYISIPCEGKAPKTKEWQKWPDDIELQKERINHFIKTKPQENIGLLTGKINQTIAVDIDVEDEDFLNELLKRLPNSDYIKKGKKGATLFYDYNNNVAAKSHRFERDNKIYQIEILSDGNQTILPPSIHPETKKSYVWISKKTLDLVNAGDLNTSINNENVFSIFYNLCKEEGLTPLSNSNSVGRNEGLKKVVVSMLSRGERLGKIVSEIIREDEFINDIPLFSDPKENIKGANPEEKANNFVKSIRKSLKDIPLEDRSSKEYNQKKNNDKNKERILALAKDMVEITGADLPCVSAIEVVEKYKLSTTNTGVAHNNQDNVSRILEQSLEFKDFIWTDTFHNKTFTNWNPYSKNRDNNPKEWNLDKELLGYLQRYYFLNQMRLQHVEGAIEIAAKRLEKNEPKDWMETLSWDGFNRVEMFFHNYFGSPNDEYTKAISKNWWISIAARIYDPGCKVDNMLILEGAQGKKKSSALNIIAGKWFGESTEDMNTKDFARQLQGKMILELGELSSLNKSEVNRIKQIITIREDEIRGIRERYHKKFKRQGVLVGSTNDTQYLKDATGGRRFWPIVTTEFDLDMLARDRDQLFAEAVSLYKSGQSWWEVPTQAIDEQEARRMADPWEPIIEDWLQNREEVSCQEIFKFCLGFENPKDINPRDLPRVTSILKILKWTSDKNPSRRNGSRSRRWHKIHQ